MPADCPTKRSDESETIISFTEHPQKVWCSNCSPRRGRQRWTGLSF